MRVLGDTNLFIYLIERHPIFHPKVDSLYREHRKSGDEIITSALTLGELLAQPLRPRRLDWIKGLLRQMRASAGFLADAT